VGGNIDMQQPSRTVSLMGTIFVGLVIFIAAAIAIGLWLGGIMVTPS
jgi:hypothetical protein